MTREDDFIGQLEGYLDEYEGHTPLPDAIREAIRAELPTTRQIGPLSGLMRNLNMTMRIPPAARYGLVAAVVVAAVLLGVTLLGRGPDAGGPDSTPTPIPTPSPTPPPLAGDNLDPGIYSIARGTLHATITVPAGWANLDQRGVAKGGDQAFVVVVFWPFPADFNEVYADPCNWKTSVIEPRVGPSVDDLANALAAQAMRGDATPTDVTIDGYEGKYLEMSVPDDVVLADCDEGEFRSWAGRYHQGPGQIDRVYILDVDGQRQVFIAHHMPAVSDADLAEQQAIVESINFLP